MLRLEASLIFEDPVIGPKSDIDEAHSPRLVLDHLLLCEGQEVYIATGGRLDPVNLTAFLHLHEVK